MYRPTDDDLRLAALREDNAKDFGVGRNDRVFLTENTISYKNGDEATVVRVTAYLLTISIRLDQEEHEMLLALKASRDDPDADRDLFLKHSDELPYDFELHTQIEGKEGGNRSMPLQHTSRKEATFRT